jgi:hypothetical protein
LKRDALSCGAFTYNASLLSESLDGGMLWIQQVSSVSR